MVLLSIAKGRIVWLGLLKVCERLKSRACPLAVPGGHDKETGGTGHALAV